MLQRGNLIGVEFCQQVIGAIVNLPTLKRRTLNESMSLFEGILGLWAQAFDVIPERVPPVT